MPIVRLFGDPDHAGRHRKQAGIVLDALKEEMSRSGQLAGRRRVLMGDVEIDAISAPDGDHIRIYAQPPALTDEAQVEDKSPGRKGVFFARMEDQSCWWIQVDADGVLVWQFVPGIEDYWDDLSPGRKSLIIEGADKQPRRFVFTVNGRVFGAEKSLLDLGLSGESWRFHRFGEYFCWYRSGIYEIEYRLVEMVLEPGQEIRFNLLSEGVLSEKAVSGQDLSFVPTFIHRRCYGSYWDSDYTIGKHVDAGYISYPLDADGQEINPTEHFANKLTNHSEGEYLFNLHQDLERLAPLFNEVEWITPTECAFLILTRPKVYISSEDPPHYGMPWAYDATHWMSPRFVRATLDLLTGQVKSAADSIPAPKRNIWTPEGFGSAVNANAFEYAHNLTTEGKSEETECNCVPHPNDESLKLWVEDQVTSNCEDASLRFARETDISTGARPYHVRLRSAFRRQRASLELESRKFTDYGCFELTGRFDFSTPIDVATPQTFTEWAYNPVSMVFTILSDTFAGFWTCQEGEGTVVRTCGNIFSVWDLYRGAEPPSPFYPSAGSNLDGNWVIILPTKSWFNADEEYYYVRYVQRYFYRANVNIDDSTYKRDDDFNLYFQRYATARTPKRVFQAGNLVCCSDIVEKSSLVLEQRGAAEGRLTIEIEDSCTGTLSAPFDWVSGSAENAGHFAGFSFDIPFGEDGRLPSQDIAQSLDMACLGANDGGDAGLNIHSGQSEFSLENISGAAPEVNRGYFLDNRMDSETGGGALCAVKAADGWRIYYDFGDGKGFADVSAAVLQALGAEPLGFFMV